MIARLRGDTRERSMVTHCTGDDDTKELREAYLKYWPELGITPYV